jgi:ubiquinone/menaquinone biosynthesis C-methylase UbiE
MSQRGIFLEHEGNAWHQRNSARVQARQLPDDDPALRAILELSSLPESGARILEIGCGDGSRLAWLKEHRRFECFGLDPSSEAIAVAQQRGIDARQGTAERLTFDDKSFDILVFGFCLYLCDRDDLFRIAFEADRVLRNPGWLLIFDFFSPVPRKREYHHRAGLYSYKMDYRTMFDWNPAYTTVTQRVRQHGNDGYTDDPEEWTAVSVLRKNITDG